MLVLNLKINPSCCVAENMAGEDGVYGSAKKKKQDAPEKMALKSSPRSAAPVELPTPVVEQVVNETLIPPVFEPVEVTQLTPEQRKYANMYVKMHKKEIDTSDYKIKVYIAQTKEQHKEKPRPIKRAQTINPEVVNPEIITPEEVNTAFAGTPEEVKKTNWFKRLFEKIKEFFRKLFKRKKVKSNGDSEDLSA